MSVGDVIVVDKLTAEVGTTVELEPVMIVDGDKVITDKKELENKKVAVEVVGPAKGPKITIVKYKNKTGYRKRMGHRQKLTTVKVTGI